MAKKSAPRDGTKIDLRVFVRRDAPHGVGYEWLPAAWNEAEHRWDVEFTPDPVKGGHLEIANYPEWRPLGATARIEAKQKSVGDKWVITNGDPEFMVKDGFYWVMPRGEPSRFDGSPQRTSPLPVKALDIYNPEDPDGLLSGHYWDGAWPNGEEGQKERATTFTIKASQVWAVRKRVPVDAPNVAEPRVYETVGA